MAHRIPPEIDARVQSQLASGNCDSADAVLRKALDAHERRLQSGAASRDGEGKLTRTSKQDGWGISTLRRLCGPLGSV